MLLVLALLLELRLSSRLFGFSLVELFGFKLGPNLGLLGFPLFALLLLEVALDGHHVGSEDGTERVEEIDEGLLSFGWWKVA